MDILKDIEKNILNINMYDKSVEPAKLNKIKAQIGEYFKYKDEENNIISQKIMNYEEEYKKPRERNNYEYELFLEKKDELRSIFKETKTLASLYDYLNYKYANDHQSIPDIYTYDNSGVKGVIVSRAKVPKEPKEPKEPKVPKEPKEPKEPKDPKEPKVPKVPKEPKVPKVPKEPKKDVKAPKALKDCPEGKVRNPITKRCIKDVNYKKI